MNLNLMNLILNTSLLLLLGMLAGKIVNKAKFPAVTGYLIMGIVIGPSFLNLLTHRMLNAAVWLSHGALGLIAFSIGSEFTVRTIRRLGKSVIWIAFLEAFGAALLVTVAMLLILRQPLANALLYGAIASATAPAATIMVIREFRAKGPLTDTLLAVVAIDDPICVINFAIASGVALMLLSGHVTSVAGMILRPLLEILAAIALGAMLGVATSLIGDRIKTQAELLTFTLGAILLGTGLALQTGLSPLLVNMALGAAVGNLARQNEAMFEAVRAMDTPIYVAFFTLSGAGLHVGLLKSIGLVGLVYVIVRVAGKVAGAALGAKISGAPRVVLKYLGLGLVPQAGVALGLSLLAKQILPDLGDMISTTIVATTVIYELIGPLCAKLAIKLAGEDGGMDREYGSAGSVGISAGA
ncbi:MAG: cation:proton antiporter [Bacteroidota bacterium]